MEVTLGMFLFLFALAFVMELIDSSLGMGYGTVLSPILIIMGFNPLVAIPALLLSQAFGGLTASIFHHKYDNANFSKKSKDLKIVGLISLCGIFATVLSAIIALNLPKMYIKTYIGVLVLVMGVILLANKKFRFSWKRMFAIGIISAFNKGLSGGGFGPVVTSGQIIAGQENKNAIGSTTLAEAPICIIGFFTYAIGNTIKNFEGSVLNMNVGDFFHALFSRNIFQWELVMALLLGSVMVAPFGAFVTKLIKDKKLTFILGILVTGLGIWTLVKTYM